MTPEVFIEAYKEAFGADTQSPIAFGYSDEPVAETSEICLSKDDFAVIAMPVLPEECQLWRLKDSKT